jgi:hypothetical protein
MGKRSKRKKKKNKGTAMSTPTPPTPNQPTPPASQRQIRFVEGLALFLTALGLIALIELWPRPTPGASLPTNISDQLSSSRFTITNDGYLRLTDVKAACFMWKLQYGGRVTVNMPGSFSNIVSPPESILQTSEGLTVPCTAIAPFTYADNSVPILKEADLAIAFYYRPWPIPFLRCHRLFRFVARFNEKGEIVGWDKQPAKILEPDFEKFMEWRKTQSHLPQL